MKKDEVWRTKDGKEIEVKNMSEDHVRNALRSILRHQRIARRSHHNQDSLIHFEEYPNVENFKRSREYEENDMAADYVDGNP